MYNHESFLSLIIDNITDGLCVFPASPESPGPRFSVWNRKMVELTGYTIEEINASNWYHLLTADPVIREKVHRQMEEVCRGNNLHDKECEIIGADGRKRKVSISTSLVRANDDTRHVMAVIKDSTPAAQTEKRLLENEKRFRMALESAYIIFFEWDIQNNKVRRFYSTEPALQATGEEQTDTFETVLGKVHPDDRDRFEANVNEALAHEEGMYQSEFRIIRSDGEVAWLLERGRVDFDGEGRPIRLLGLSQDITRIKRTEALALNRLKEIESLYQNAPVGLCALDRNLRFLRINERLAEINGIPVDEHIGKQVRDILPELADLTEPGFLRILETGEPLLDIEIVGETPAQPGFKRCFLENWLPMTDSEGRVMGINIVVEEITQRRQTEIVLEHQRELLQRIVDNIPVLLVMWDPNLKSFTLNRCAEEVLGITTAEANAGDMMAKVYPDPEYRSQVSKYMQSLQSGWREWIITASGGEHVPTDWANIRLTDNTMIGIGVDLRQRKHAEQERERLIKELETANKELEGFIYSMTHDIKTPIRHIVSFSELLRQKHPDSLDAKGKQYLDIICTASWKLNTLVDELLHLMSMGRTPLQKSEVDLAVLVREVMKFFTDQPTSRNIRWTVGNLPVVRGDASMLSRVFTNLLSNAVKFTRDREEGHIEIMHQEEEKEHIVFVRDNGTGFNMKYADKIFKVFQRLHAESEFEGTGIGLASVERIMQRHEGRVWTVSQIDRGATFFLSFPKKTGNNQNSRP